MRSVEPQVFLVASSTPHAGEMRRYLEAVEGDSWLDRRQEPGAWMTGENLIEFGGRLCYRSWEPGLNANVTRVREDAEEYFRNLLASGHGSVLEHSSLSFVFHNVSRVFTHELVRHRAGTAVSQESMRFVRLTDIPFWLPEWTKDHPQLVAKAARLLQDMEDFQRWMAEYFQLDDDGVPFAEKKAKTSFMRRFAPDGVATGVLWTANVRALRHCISMRTDAAAEEEIRLVFDKVAALARAEAPLLFGDYTRSDDGQWSTENWKV